MKTLQQKATLAGFIYLAYIIIAILADALGRSRLIVYTDAAATARNIAASEGLFRFSFVGDLLSGLLFFLTAWALYGLLKPVNENLAALLLSSGADYLNAFQAEQLQALALAFLNLHKQGFWICQIFFGAWLFPLGYLVFKSGFLPKILGVILMVHCVGWLMTFGQYFLFPDFNAITYVTYPLGLIAEFGLSLGLLFFGARGNKTAAAAIV